MSSDGGCCGTGCAGYIVFGIFVLALLVLAPHLFFLLLLVLGWMALFNMLVINPTGKK